MYAEIFRQYYDYHFAENRATWEKYIVPLTQEQFTQAAGYSHGSVQNQVLHLINVEDAWFSELRNIAQSEPLDAGEWFDRKNIRVHWDTVEQKMHDYLDGLADEMLLSKPITEPDEDRGLTVWQVLLHVINHATDHRAQLLRLLNEMGVETVSQDYIFYAYDHGAKG